MMRVNQHLPYSCTDVFHFLFVRFSFFSDPTLYPNLNENVRTSMMIFFNVRLYADKEILRLQIILHMKIWDRGFLLSNCFKYRQSEKRVKLRRLVSNVQDVFIVFEFFVFIYLLPSVRSLKYTNPISKFLTTKSYPLPFLFLFSCLFFSYWFQFFNLLMFDQNVG